jgi:hypothetical protein
VSRASRAITAITAVIVPLALAGCAGDDTAPPSPEPADRISTDAELLELVMQREPFTTFTLFPSTDSLISGRLEGSEAHQPLVRVSMNAKALSALVSDTLPEGASFPDSSIIFKEVRGSSTIFFYAVMYKDSDNPLAANGWLWGEYRANGLDFPNGSIQNRGANCVGCHSLEDGPRHDLVRTFERQNER